MNGRNRFAKVEDRWTKTVRDEQGNKSTVPSSDNGRGKRWRARYVDDEGRQHAKSFDRKADAQIWLDNEITPAPATGSYVPPDAGLVSVGAVYASWSAAQAHIAAKTAQTRRNVRKSRVEPQWGHVAVADVRTAAIRSWVAKLAAEGVGVPTIENAFGVLGPGAWRCGRGPADTAQPVRFGEAPQASACRPGIPVARDRRDTLPSTAIHPHQRVGIAWCERTAQRHSTVAARVCAV